MKALFDLYTQSVKRESKAKDNAERKVSTQLSQLSIFVAENKKLTIELKSVKHQLDMINTTYGSIAKIESA